MIEEKLKKYEDLLVKWVDAADAFDAVPAGAPDGEWSAACAAWEAAQEALMQAGREAKASAAVTEVT